MRFEPGDDDESPFDSTEPTQELLFNDADDLPTVDEERSPVASPRPRHLSSSEILSASLPVDANTAYEVFCDTESIPRWLSVVQSVRVLGRHPAGRAMRAAFLARLHHAAVGYTLVYRYDDQRRSVAWGTDPGSTTLVAGRARFIPLGDRASLMEYQLVLELPEYVLPPWEDPFYSGNATSVVMNDFREYVIRKHRSWT